MFGAGIINDPGGLRVLKALLLIRFRRPYAVRVPVIFKACKLPMSEWTIHKGVCDRILEMHSRQIAEVLKPIK